MRQELGTQGETQAAEFLRLKGFTILSQNRRERFSEADIICQDGDTIVLVEVKTRSGQFADPLTALTPAKLRRLRRSLALLAAQHPTRNIRLDAVTVYWKPGTEPVLTHYTNLL